MTSEFSSFQLADPKIHTREDYTACQRWSESTTIVNKMMSLLAASISSTDR